MNEKVFNGPVNKLRSKERLEILEVDKVVKCCLEGLNSSTVLDIGTGTGVFAEAFEKSGCNVSAIDTNSDFMKIAKEFAPKALFKIGCAEKLEFDDNSFDIVFMGHVLHEVDSLQDSIREARRVCKKRFAVLEWPRKVEEMGPPIGHRLDLEKVKKIAELEGFLSFREISLKKLVLWIFE